MRIVRNVLAIIVGAVVGGIVNMKIIMMSDSIIPLPQGVNPEDMDSLARNMHFV